MGFEKFEKFGIVTHTKESKAVDFVTYLEQGKVMATRYRECGVNYFPPQVDCPKCIVSDMEWFEIKGNGRLLTYTMVSYGPLGFEDKAPYLLGIGEFEGGIKIFAVLSWDIKESDIKVGMPLKVAPVKSNDKVFFELQAGR